MKKVLILPDVHLTTLLPKPYIVTKEFIKKNKFDEIILLGDFMDVSSLSGWDLDKKRLMENRRYLKEVDVANAELDFLQKFSKEVTYIIGNHEDRVERYLDTNPEMEGLIEVENVLKLKERNIKVIKFNQLYKLGRCYFTHGLYTNLYHSNKHIHSLGCNIVYGHSHKPQIDCMNMKMQKPIMGYGLGCLCDMAAPYMRGRPANWMNQFAVMYVDNKGMFNIYPVNIINNRFIYEGVTYEYKKNI